MAKTKLFDAAEYLDDPKIVAEYLRETRATGDATLVDKALDNVARRSRPENLPSGKKS
jgi:DNA-binding phage protein